MMEILQAIPEYGEDCLLSLDDAWFQNAVVICAPEAWALVETQFKGEPLAVFTPATMEQSALEAHIERMPKQAEVFFGIGGGSACDAAKMAKWMKGGKLVLLPSVLSVDAPYTKAVGVRVGSHVRYVAEVFPDKFLIDFNLLKKSPPNLNRAGVGDILSIHTALFDWKLAMKEVDEDYDELTALRSEALLDMLLEGAEEIAALSTQGLRLISQLYVGEVRLCEQFGNSRPEEGSEHYFAYCLESLTKKHYLHGELIAMSILLTSLYQGQETEKIARFLKRSKVRFHPEEVGVTFDEIRQTLLGLPDYLKRESQLPYGIYHHDKMTEAKADLLIERFRSFL